MIFFQIFYSFDNNAFLAKILKKNVDFLLNKVRKIANKNFFMIKYKMLYIYDFHIDFQFQAQKVMLSKS